MDAANEFIRLISLVNFCCLAFSFSMTTFLQLGVCVMYVCIYGGLQSAVSEKEIDFLMYWYDDL